MDRFISFFFNMIFTFERLWFKEFLDLWTTLSICYEWEPYLLRLLTKVAEHSLCEFNWTPYIPFVTENFLRFMSIFFLLNKVFLTNF